MDENQIVEEYLLPDDYEEPEEETTEAEEIESESEELEEDVQVEAVEETTEETEAKELLEELEVKFLHDTKKLKDFDKEELKTIVQKGLNHDRLLEKVTIANERTEKIRELSELYKMSENELIDALYDQYFTTTAEQQGKDKDYVKLAYEANKKQSTQKMYERFATKYPDVKADAIPTEVWQAVQEGEDLSRAYDNHMKETTILTKDSEVNKLKSEIEELKGKLKAQQSNEEVKKKAVVKSTSKNGNETVEGDEFLQGFFGN